MATYPMGVQPENVLLFQKLIQGAAENSSPCIQDPETWFSGEYEDIALAKRLCRDCPLQRECLDYAIRNNEQGGVWGGMTHGDRYRLRLRIARQERDIDDV